MAGFFSFLSAIFSFFSARSAAKRDEALRNEGRISALKETADSNLAQIKQRVEAVNEGSDKPYDGDPNNLRDWLRAKRETGN